MKVAELVAALEAAAKYAEGRRANGSRGDSAAWVSLGAAIGYLQGGPNARGEELEPLRRRALAALEGICGDTPGTQEKPADRCDKTAELPGLSPFAGVEL